MSVLLRRSSKTVMLKTFLQAATGALAFQLATVNISMSSRQFEIMYMKLGNKGETSGKI